MKENKIKKFGLTLKNQLRSFDRTALVSICTGGIFAVMGIFQLVLVLLAPVSHTADHFFLIAADILIAIGCFGYAFFRQRGHSASDRQMRDPEKETDNRVAVVPQAKKSLSGTDAYAERTQIRPSDVREKRPSSQLPQRQ